MDGSDGDENTKKSKKIQKRKLNKEEDIEPVKKSKKKAKKEAEDQLSQNNVDHFGENRKEKEVIEAENDTSKPKEKSKKKKKKVEHVSGEEIQNRLLKDGFGSDDSEVEAHVKPEKKRKKNQEAGEESTKKTDENVAVSPKKNKKEKKLKKIAEAQRNGDVSGEEHREVEGDEADKAVTKKKAKTSSKIPKNLHEEHELLSDDQPPEEVSSKPIEEVKSKKKAKNLPKTSPNLEKDPVLTEDELPEKTVPKTPEPVKRKKKSKAAPKSQQMIYDEPRQLSSDDEIHEQFLAVPSPLIRKPEAPEVADVPKPKRQVRRKTKIPVEDQLTLGGVYKMKSVKEKNCKSCSETVKFKIKTKVRDMGTQTLESALINVLKSKNPPKIKETQPLQAEDRIIRPTQPSDDEENMDIRKKKTPKFTNQQIDFLRNMVIVLKEEPLPQHQIGNRAGCRPLETVEKKKFREYAKLRMGPWDPDEDQILVKNWLRFCKKHDWNPKYPEPFTSLRHKGAFYMPKVDERIKFVQFLARNLPNRCLYSVLGRFRSLYSPRRMERYTPEEDQEILAYMATIEGTENKRQFVPLADKLNRTRESVYRRWKLLQKQIEQS